MWYTLGAEVIRPCVHSSSEMMAGLRTIVFLMDIFRNLYANADHFLQCVDRLVGFARSAKITDSLFGRQTPKATGSNQIDLVARSVSGSQCWPDDKHCQDGVHPHQCYLWLSLSLDYSLRHGDLPNVVNFPSCLQQNAKTILAGQQGLCGSNSLITDVSLAK